MAMVLDSDIAIGVGSEMDDIERELCCSSREASVSYVLFAILGSEAMCRAREALPRPQRDNGEFVFGV